jgi:UDP-sugar diphosphatase
MHSIDDEDVNRKTTPNVVQRMKNVTNVSTTDPSTTPIHSKYAKVIRMSYTQDNTPKIWDIVLVMDSICVLVYHKERNTFLFVKQFRPAVFHSLLKSTNNDNEQQELSKLIEQACTIELCAGLVDKDKSLVHIAQEEVLEECGYNVPLDQFEKVKTGYGSTGKSAPKSTLFYCAVDDSMKVSNGGGLVHEGEIIEVVEMDVDHTRTWMYEDDDAPIPTSLCFAVEWFFNHKR